MKVVVIIKRDIIHGENHANEVTECAGRNGIITDERYYYEEVRKKCSQALIPSLCEILVYNDETSSVTSKELAVKLLMVRSLLRKSLVSFC